MNVTATRPEQLTTTISVWAYPVFGDPSNFGAVWENGLRNIIWGAGFDMPSSSPEKFDAAVTEKTSLYTEQYDVPAYHVAGSFRDKSAIDAIEDAMRGAAKFFASLGGREFIVRYVASTNNKLAFDGHAHLSVSEALNF